MENKIYVTQPSLPDINEYKKLLDKIWDKKWITNNGDFHRELEERLKEYLNVDYLSLVSNGTLSLLLSIKALNLKGEIITTPFTYIATTNAIEWMGCKPVFCDIKNDDFNIDCTKIEALINENTVAIMPVHVFGSPCNHEEINKIALKYNLKIIYDAAHAFNVKDNNYPILNYGHYSSVSFHATKAFNTIEGGCIISHSKKDKEVIDQLRNFGYDHENIIVRSGINSKMNEFQAAFGLLQLDNSESQIQKRKIIYQYYKKELSGIKGLIINDVNKSISHNYTYFPIRINANFKISAAELEIEFNKKNIFPRRYFYPLVSNTIPYKNNISSKRENLPIANLVADEILCLPMYESLTESDQIRIIKIINGCNE